MPPILETVKEAEKILLKTEKEKCSFSMLGSQRFQRSIQKLLFPNQKNDDIVSVQTVGSCGALYLSGQVIHEMFTNSKIWISNPTWENHRTIFNETQNEIKEYCYMSAKEGGVSVEKIFNDLKNASKNDFVLFHVCCHNPTGIDPTISQWKELSKFCREKQLLPIFDFAYQGFANGLSSDAAPLEIFKKYHKMMIVCNSFSKNMGLYDERVGALSLVHSDKEFKNRFTTLIKRKVRSSYSIPPVHGAKIVELILNDTILYRKWIEELSNMKKTLDDKRSCLFKTMADYEILDKLVDTKESKGMFVCLKLSVSQIDKLREKFGIYILYNGRISIASIALSDVDNFCKSLLLIV
ncbi:aminotransferase class I/II-fold pyridoxal phosphate-dependent enzyme [Lactococcus lactis subsp. lactis]|nr:aminotransferase class I/II-fold pyridoxal phosphate-dependent enzyme [Lactococcus lactis subsp. lactis]